MKYEFCPICGRKLDKVITGDEGIVPFCPNDEFYYFDTPNPCIMVSVIKGDEVLLLKQSYIYANSMVLISGYIGIDEKAEDTVYREVLEETSIEIENVKFLGTDFIEGREILMLTYSADFKAGIIKPSKEVEEAIWVKIADAFEKLGENEIGKRVLKKAIEKELTL
jgi:NAD+ diphosphatase